VIGAQALILSLVKHSERRDLPIIVLHTRDVSKASLRTLQKIKRVQLRVVDKMQGPADAARSVESRSDFTKIHIWNLVEYSKILYLDADMLVMDDISELFERDLGQLRFAAAPDVYPPDRFNAGCILLEPDQARFENMLINIPVLPSYDGGDTGFLNAFFPEWYESPSRNRLPFAYNAQRTLFWMTNQAQPGYWKAIGKKKILHFSSSPKPWLDSERKGELEMLWWSTYTELLTSFTMEG